VYPWISCIQICLQSISKAFKPASLHWFNSLTLAVNPWIHVFLSNHASHWELSYKLLSQLQYLYIVAQEGKRYFRLYHLYCDRKALTFSSILQFCFDDSPLSFDYWHTNWLWRMEHILCSKTFLESRRQMKFKPTNPTNHNCNSLLYPPNFGYDWNSLKDLERTSCHWQQRWRMNYNY